MTSDSADVNHAEFARACALAGYLAEQGVASLQFETGTACVEMIARHTDLPRAIVELREGSAIKSDSPPRFRVWRKAGALRSQGDDAALRRAFGV